MDVIASRSLRVLTSLWLLGVFGVLGGFSCADDDGKAEQDLTEDQITNHLGDTDVIVNADHFPNFAHTCWLEGPTPVGFWSTTDRVTIIVYNDWLCEGATRESPMTVLTGSPRDIVNAGG